MLLFVGFIYCEMFYDIFLFLILGFVVINILLILSESLCNVFKIFFLLLIVLDVYLG